MELNGTRISELEVYRLVNNKGKVSRSDLEEIVGNVSSSTLYRMLDQLVQKQYLFEESGTRTSNGRPPKIYRINSAAALAVGVFVSWDCIGIALINIGGELSAKKLMYGAESMTPRKAIQAISKEIRTLVTENARSENISGIGVSAFGPIIKDKGILNHGYHKLSPAWDYVPLKDLLEKETNFPVCVDNLVSACLLNELGNRRELRQKKVVYILLDKGIGSAFFSPGGAPSSKDTSSQLGHMMIDFRGAPCVCGKKGCLETYASAEAIVKKLGLQGARLQTHISDPYEILSDLPDRSGGDFSGAVFDEIAEALTAAILNYCSILGPDSVLIGGRTVDTLPLLLDRVERNVLEITQQNNDHETFVIEKTNVDHDALLRGSANIMFKSRYGMFT
jgi:predicted NBD/HSP70 family sugar kinase